MWCHVVLGIFLSRHPGTTASTGQWTHHSGVARFYQHVTKTWNKQNSWRPFCVSATNEAFGASDLSCERHRETADHVLCHFNTTIWQVIISTLIQSNLMGWNEVNHRPGTVFIPALFFKKGFIVVNLTYGIWFMISLYVLFPKTGCGGVRGGYFKDAQSLSCLSQSAAGRYKWWKQDVLWVVSFTSVWTHRQFPSKAAAERVNLHCFFNSFLPTIQITTAV